MNTEIKTLAADCVTHLEREESLLESLQVVVQHMRAALLSTNNDELGELIDQQSNVAVEIESISSHRRLLRQRISQACSIPEAAATVGLLAEQCDDPWRLALEGYRVRLKTAGEGLNALLIANGNLAVQLLELLDNVFRSLSGEQARPQRYERTGRPSML